MNRGDLKANAGDAAEMVRAECDSVAFDLTPPAATPRNRRRGACVAFVLSVLVHVGLVGALALAPRGSSSLFPGTSIMDTRAPTARLAIDGFVTFPSEAPPQRTEHPKPLTPEVEKPKSFSTSPNPDTHPVAEPPNGPGNAAESAAGIQHRDQEGSGMPAVAGTMASFFRIPIRSRRVVFVIDCSASMGLDGKLVMAKSELLACLVQLAPTTEVQVIAYNRLAEPLRLAGGFGPATASSEVKSEIEHALANIHAEGGTNHMGALKRALLLWPDEIIFLTDADDLTEEQVREVIRTNGGRAVIHAVEMLTTVPDAGTSPLQRLANANRGQYMAVSTDTAAQLSTSQR